MSLNFYASFVDRFADNPKLKDGFDKLIGGESDGESLDATARAKLADALASFTSDPRFAVTAYGLMLRAGRYFAPTPPPLLTTGELQGRSALPSLDVIDRGMDANRAMYRRVERASPPYTNMISLFMSARYVTSINFSRVHDLGLLSVLLGFRYGTGGGMLTGMEDGNMGAETGVVIRQAPYQSTYVAMKLPFENPSAVPAEMELTTLQETFITRLLGVLMPSGINQMGTAGIGTVHEVLASLNLMQRGITPVKPIILTETTHDGKFLASFVEYLGGLIADGAVDPRLADIIFQANDASEYAKTLAYLRLARATGNQAVTDQRDYVSHADHDKTLRAMLRHDHELLSSTFENLDRKRTISVYAPEGSYDVEFGGEGAALIKALKGANILMNGGVSRSFVESADTAADTLTQGALLHVRGITDVDTLGRGAKTGKVRFHTDLLQRAATSYYSGAAVFYPGGLNVHTALFETMTLQQTLQIPGYPIILVGGEKAWGKTLTLLREMLRYGTIKESDLEYDFATGRGRILVVENTAEAVVLLKKLDFGNQLPVIKEKPHREACPVHEDLINILRRELAAHGIDESAAGEIAARTVLHHGMRPMQLVTGAEKFIGAEKMHRLERAEDSVGANGYTRMVAGAVGLARPELLESFLVRQEGLPPLITGELTAITRAAIRDGRDEVEAVTRHVMAMPGLGPRLALNPTAVLPPPQAFRMPAMLGAPRMI